LADGVLMVVRSGQTPKEAFTRTCDLLSSVKSRVLGVVLNAVDASSPDYYYSYRYYPYSYGGYGREDRDKKRPEETEREKEEERVETSV
jgi:polysaccharide biosynthesis transport protein